MFSLVCQAFFQKVFLDKISNGEGGIWTLAPLLTTYSLSRRAPSATWVLLQVLTSWIHDERRGWDSNPRALSDKRFSRPPRYDHFDTSPYLQQWKSAYWTSPVQRTLWYHMYISYVKTLFYILQIFLLFSIIAERIFLLNCFFYFIWYKIPAVSRKNPQYSRCLAQNLSMTLCFYFWRVYLFADKRFCHL